MKIQSWSLIGIIAIIVIVVSLLYGNSSKGAEWANEHLDTNGVQLYMPREEVEKLLNEPPLELAGETKEYSYRFEQSGLEVSYDHKQTGKVRSISLLQDRYSVFGIRLGGSLKEAAESLKQYGLRVKVESEGYYQLAGRNIVVTLVASVSHDQISAIVIELQKGRLSDDVDY